MASIFLLEPFDNLAYDPRLSWYNPPQRWSIHNSWLQVEPESKTDYWQQPHHGIQSDNGPFLHCEVLGDFVLSTQVRMHPANQYDQAGLMVRLSPSCWLKTSVEFESGIPSKLGAVVTNHGYSDWSTQDYHAGSFDFSLRVRREGFDYTVDYSPDGAAWSQIRFAHLLDDDGARPLQCGLYACSPIAAGFLVEFGHLKIE
jgi:uncharacterized protein